MKAAESLAVDAAANEDMMAVTRAHAGSVVRDGALTGGESPCSSARHKVKHSSAAFSCPCGCCRAAGEDILVRLSLSLSLFLCLSVCLSVCLSLSLCCARAHARVCVIERERERGGGGGR